MSSATANPSTRPNATSSSPLRVLFFGGTGNIGFHVLKYGLLSERYSKYFQVAVGCKPETLNSNKDENKKKKLEEIKSLGGRLFEFDFESASHATLVEEIRNYDILVLLTSYGTSLDTSLRVLSAAKEAGNLKLFIPSEFGSLYSEMDFPTAVPNVNDKIRFNNELKQSGVPYALIHTGAYYEYFFNFFGGIDLRNHSITAPGSMDFGMTAMSEKDGAQMTAEIILNYHAPHIKNQSIKLGTEKITWKDATEMLEKKTNSPWKKSVKSVEEMEERWKKAYENGQKPQMPLVMLLGLERWHLMQATQQNKGLIWDTKGEDTFWVKHQQYNPNFKPKLITAKQFVESDLNI